MDEPVVVAAIAPQASSSDGGAKQALENEFECTICRVSCVARSADMGITSISNNPRVRMLTMLRRLEIDYYSMKNLTSLSVAGLHGGHPLSRALRSYVLWRVFVRMVAKESVMSQM